MQVFEVFTKEPRAIGSELVSEGRRGRVLTCRPTEMPGICMCECAIEGFDELASREVLVEQIPNLDAEPLTVVLKLGTPRILHFDLNAMCMFEELTGRKLLVGDFANLRIGDLRAFICAALQHEQPGITVQEVGKLMTPDMIPEAYEVIGKLLSSSDTDGRSMAPFVASPRDVVERMLEVAEVGPGKHVADLGCGDGRVLLAATMRGATAVGYEINPQRAEMVRKALKDWGITGQAELREEDLLQADLSKADVVFLYLLSRSNARLRVKLLAELPAGARVVSHDFGMPGWEPYCREVVTAEGRQHTVYAWEVDSVRATVREQSAAIAG